MSSLPCDAWVLGRCMFAVTFYPFNIECNRGLRSLIFYDELIILECDSRHSLLLYFFCYPNLIRHHTKKLHAQCTTEFITFSYMIHGKPCFRPTPLKLQHLMSFNSMYELPHNAAHILKPWYKIARNSLAMYIVHINRTLSFFKFVHRTWNDLRSDFALSDRLSKSTGFKYWFSLFSPIIFPSSCGFQLVDFKNVICLFRYFKLLVVMQHIMHYWCLFFL